MHELRGEREPALEDQLARLAPVDITLVEGYKRAPIPKLEVWRNVNQHAPRFPEESTIIGVAVDGDMPFNCTLPVFQLACAEQIADFVVQHAALIQGS
jgi:molybdopterin-guanine dinucleotide biosynthesis protein B